MVRLLKRKKDDTYLKSLDDTVREDDNTNVVDGSNYEILKNLDPKELQKAISNALILKEAEIKKKLMEQEFEIKRKEQEIKNATLRRRKFEESAEMAGSAMDSAIRNINALFFGKPQKKRKDDDIGIW